MSATTAHTCSVYKIPCGSMFFYTVHLVATGICCLTSYLKILAAVRIVLYATDTNMLLSSFSVVNLPC